MLAVVVVLVASAYALPRQVTITRTVQIDAPPSAVFPYANSLQKVSAWSPWMQLDPAMTQNFDGPDAGEGNTMTWASENPQLGSGSQEIVVSDPDNKVVTALDFGSMGSWEATFDLVLDGAATTLTWTMTSDMGNNPVGRWMGLIMDRLVGPDFESGMANLKRLVESGT